MDRTEQIGPDYYPPYFSYTIHFLYVKSENNVRASPCRQCKRVVINRVYYGRIDQSPS